MYSDQRFPPSRAPMTAAFNRRGHNPRHQRLVEQCLLTRTHTATQSRGLIDISKSSYHGYPRWLRWMAVGEAVRCWTFDPCEADACVESIIRSRRKVELSSINKMRLVCNQLQVVWMHRSLYDSLADNDTAPLLAMTEFTCIAKADLTFARARMDLFYAGPHGRLKTLMRDRFIP